MPPELVRVGSTTSAMMILYIGAPLGCRLSSLLYSLFPHDCRAWHDSNTIIKFADDTTVTRQSETWPGGARITTYPST